MIIDASQEVPMNNAKLQCDGRNPQGFRTPESSGFGERGSARILNIDAEGLRMETEITRDRYFFRNSDSLALAQKPERTRQSLRNSR